MAEDAVDHAATLAKLDDRPCVTRTLPIHGRVTDADQFAGLAVYGSDAQAVQQLADAAPDLARLVHPRLAVTAAQVTWAARFEMARTVDDVLARRTRALFLDARTAVEAAPEVARLLAAELGRDAAWQTDQVRQLTAIADHYLIDRPRR
jgi:glycerol-3-phosphate dehydrogenase